MKCDGKGEVKCKMSVVYNEPDQGILENIDELPKEIKEAIQEDYGDDTKHIEVYSIGNDYCKIDIQMDDALVVLTSPNKTYIVKGKQGCYNINFKC